MSMEFLIATAIGALTWAGIYLSLRGRTFPVVLGIAMLKSYVPFAIPVLDLSSGPESLNGTLVLPLSPYLQLSQGVWPKCAWAVRLPQPASPLTRSAAR